ncbi:MAG: helix-turn-helix domain-containing protein [Clostridia bacterium]|nr:helix-turn-helix domain-containing protein [Clostridia bacterium]
MSFFDISHSKSKENSMAYLHSHGYYELYFQLTGTRTYFCDNKYYSFNENILIVTKPDTLHKFEHGPFERILIGVSSDMLSPTQIEFLDQLDKKAVVKLSPNKMDEIKKTLEDLFAVNDSVAQNKHILISLKFGLLLYLIYEAETGIVEADMSLKNDSLNHMISPTILKIMDYINTNYNKSFTLDDISKEFSLSKTWICKCFFQSNKLTVSQYKWTLQLNEAKRLLIDSKHSVEKIAAMVGFSSANYFCKSFKKNVGISPLQYRYQYNVKS